MLAEEDTAWYPYGIPVSEGGIPVSEHLFRNSGVTGIPVSEHLFGCLKSGVMSEIRCQFIILARKDELTSRQESSGKEDSRKLETFQMEPPAGNPPFGYQDRPHSGL